MCTLLGIKSENEYILKIKYFFSFIWFNERIIVPGLGVLHMLMCTYIYPNYKADIMIQLITS